MKDRKTRRFITRFVSAGAAFIVFVTTYALVLPAITMESEAACGIEAHQHDDSCYEDVLICGQEESDGHQHSQECYDADGNLICGQLELHTHTASCYDREGQLICGQLELEEHVHGPECFRRVIVEVDPETGEQTIVSEPDTDLETAADWEASLRDVRLTGDPRKDLIAVAKSQLGYTESSTNIATVSGTAIPSGPGARCLSPSACTTPEARMRSSPMTAGRSTGWIRSSTRGCLRTC